MKTFKSLFLILFILASFNINSSGEGGTAGGTGMTWDEILKNDYLKADFPSYEIENWTVSLNELCYVNDYLIRTKNRFLISWKSYQNAKLHVYDYVYRERVIEKKGCIDYINGSCQEGMIEDEIPLSIDINIEIWRGEWIEFGKKEYELDRCSAAQDSILI